MAKGEGSGSVADIKGDGNSGRGRTGFGIAALAVLVFGALILTRALPPTAAKPTATPIPSPSPAASPIATEPPATLQPSSMVLVGDLPAPDATVPPDAPAAIPGLGIQALADAAARVGLTCESSAPSGEGGGYTLGCEGADPGAHAKIALRASYWTLEATYEVVVSVYSDSLTSQVDPSAPIRIFAGIADVSAGESATSWVLNHLDDRDCGEGCTKGYDSLQIELSLGKSGGGQLRLSTN